MNPSPHNWNILWAILWVVSLLSLSANGDERIAPVVVAAQSQPPVVQPDSVQPPVTRPPVRPDSVLPPLPRETSPSDSASPTPPPPRVAPPRPSYRLLAGAPNMFGDLFSGGGGIISFTPPPMVINQSWRNGFPIPLFVGNSAGAGANPDPNVPINVFRGQGGALIATSIGPGVDLNGDTQPDLYPISEPVGSAPPGGFVYDGGMASFEGPGRPVGNGDNWVLNFSHSLVSPDVIVNVPAGGGGVRRIKLSENNSPQPRDRVFFNYNFFNDPIGRFGDVNRYTFGMERLLGDQLSSVELRVPFASTLASAQVTDLGTARDTEAGNLTFIYKRALQQNSRRLVAGGLGVSVPTSDSTKVFLPSGRQIVQWDSESVHLLPYLAVLSTPNEACFWQAFCQFDFDVNGSTVAAANPAGGPLTRLGNIRDVPLMFVDFGAGYRIFNNPSGKFINQVHAVTELHYTTTLRDADFVSGNGLFVGNFTQRFDVLNLTMGANFRTQNGVSIRPALVIPLRDADDRQFDYEAVVQVNVRL